MVRWRGLGRALKRELGVRSKENVEKSISRQVQKLLNCDLFSFPMVGIHWLSFSFFDPQLLAYITLCEKITREEKKILMTAAFRHMGKESEFLFLSLFMFAFLVTQLLCCFYVQICV